MPSIFVTHSRYDTAIPTFFDKAASMVETSLLYVEWEELITPPWKYIRDKLKDCEAIFIIKGPNITRNLYTSNWISYEIGLAAHSNKRTGSGEMDVWVFESSQNPVFFPVPFLTDYVVYDPDDPNHIQYLRYILEGYNERKYHHKLPEAISVTCGHNTCQVEYYLHTLLKSWNCPSCQRISQWTDDVSYPDQPLRISNEMYGFDYPGVV